MKNLYTFAILALVVAGSALGRAKAPPNYTLIDLGSLPGCAVSWGNSVNASGQVTGGTQSFNGDEFFDNNAFLYSYGVMQDLGALPGGTYSLGYGINDSGQVTGVNYFSSVVCHAFLYSGGVMDDLGTLPGGVNPQSFGKGINVHGQVTGYSNTTSGYWHAFIYSDGVMQDLGTLPNGESSLGYAINAAGQVTGVAEEETATGFTYDHAFLYSDGVMQDLGSLAGLVGDSYGEGINDNGEVTGYSQVSTGSGHAFLYTSGVMHDLGTLPGGWASAGYGINASGQVVGSSATTDYGSDHAFLYSGGVMYDLTKLVDSSGAGWYMEYAQSISDTGFITGYGYPPGGNDGQEHAFLLRPKPIIISGPSQG